MVANEGVNARWGTVPVGAPKADVKPLNTEPCVIVKWDVLDGDMPWSMDVDPMKRYGLSDIVDSGHAYATYAGDRYPKVSGCVGCGKVVNHAWHIAPIRLTVPACSAEHACHGVEKVWRKAGFAITVLRRGAVASAMVDSFGAGVGV